MSVTWIFQSNLQGTTNARMLEAVQSEGLRYVEVDIIPFSDDIPNVEVDDKAVVYGSTTMIKNAHKKGWNPGAFFSPENFRCSKWIEMYGNHMFNADGYVAALQDIADVPELFFMRPDNDLKDFSGSTVGVAEFNDFKKSVAKGGFMYDLSLPVFIAPAKNIHKEWRCFMVDGKCVASSQYRFRSLLKKDPNVPEEVKYFANVMAELWSPEKAFVMDVCENMDRQLQILELNCFNASGLYECDAKEIVRAVERLF